MHDTEYTLPSPLGIATPTGIKAVSTLRGAGVPSPVSPKHEKRAVPFRHQSLLSPPAPRMEAC